MNKQQRKTAIAAELKNRTNNAYSASTTESDFTRCHRLLSFLMRANPLYNNDGSIKAVPTVRAYFIKYDRKEYRKILNAVKYNRQSNCFKLFNIGFGINLSYNFSTVSDFKLTQLDTAKVDLNLLWQ